MTATASIQDGYYNGVITAAGIYNSRFAKEGETRYEVEFICDVKNQSGATLASGILVYSELSASYPPYDNTRQWWKITLDLLHGLGFQGDDLSTVPAQMAGKPCRLRYQTKDRNGQPLNEPRWSIYAERPRVQISGAQANAALKQMMTGAFSGFAQPAAPATPAPNPFN